MQQGNIKKALDNLDNAGYRLRCAREYMGLSEKEVADELKLMVSHVRAIEQNRSEYLVQRKPFERYLRAYARLVQLDPDAIVAMYFANHEPEPTQPVDITTRLEIPPQPVATRPIAGSSLVAANNYYHPAVLGAGFLVIGLSLFAGWGVKQLVGSSRNTPTLAQNERVEVRASARREPAAPATSKPKLAAISFEKPVTSVPAASSAELTFELQPVEVAVQQRAVAEKSTDNLPAVSSTPAVAKRRQVPAQRVEKVALQDVTVDVKPRPVIEPKPVTRKVVIEKAVVAAGNAASTPTPPASAAVKVPASAKPQLAVVAKSAKTVDAIKATAVAKPTILAPKKVVAAKADVVASDAKEPALAFATVDSALSRDTDERDSFNGPKTKPLGSQTTSESNAARLAVTTASQPVTTALQPLTVSAKQRIAAQPANISETPQADNRQQALSAIQSAPLADSISQDYAAEVKVASDLEDEASDLDAIINDAVNDAQPFELALANSSDSASVARLALLESYKSTLRRRVYENVSYPGKARRRNQAGKVVMSATVSRAGELLSVEIAEASKYSSLNRASEKAIKNANPFPAAPDTLAGDSFVLTVPVVFKVPDR